LLFLVTSIHANGNVAAGIHDCISEEYAGKTYGLDGADVYVCDLSLMTAYHRGTEVTLSEVKAEDTAAAVVRPVDVAPPATR
jgi:hypothetical protein